MDLQLVTDRGLTLGRSLLDLIPAAVKGGVSLVQLREKDCSTLEFVNLAREVVKRLQPLNVPMLINDRVDVALAVGAQGVHLGQQDLPWSMARELLGPRAIIGLSVESPEQALAAENFAVDYLGLSPIFATRTKTDTAAPLGLEGIRRIRHISRHQLIAIGGISTENAAAVITAGADGLAVVSAICSAEDPALAATRLKSLLRTQTPEGHNT